MKLYSLNITCINRFNYNIYRIVTIGNIPIGWSICGTNNITGTIYFTNIPIYWHTVFIISLLKYFYITESGNIFLTFESVTFWFKSFFASSGLLASLAKTIIARSSLTKEVKNTIISSIQLKKKQNFSINPYEKGLLYKIYCH